MSEEKRQLLIEALQGVNDSLELRYASPRVRAEMLADRVIAEGWQWHPPKEQTEILFENGNVVTISEATFTGNSKPVEIIEEDLT